jgi:thiol:disulfide interchange protein DsbG
MKHRAPSHPLPFPLPFATRPALLAMAAAALLAACKPAPEPAATTAPAAPPQAAQPGASAPAAATAPTTAYTIAASGHGFSTGPMMSAHTVYVFFDTTCPHCAHLWQAVQGMGDSKLKVVWMPIGLLRPQSGPQGATILAAADPAAAMAANEASVLANGKGIDVPGTVDAATLDKVKANTELFRQLNADSVPLIVYRNAKTGEIGQHAGAVDAARLTALAGL